MVTRALKLVCYCAALVLAASCVRLSDEGTLVCKADADCASDARCLQLQADEEKQCVIRGYCEQNAHCASGERCVEKQCVVPECTIDDPCRPYACDGTLYRCDTVCTYLYDCYPGYVCDQGQCVTPTTESLLANGEACTGSDECESGLCCQGAMAFGICDTTCSQQGSACTSDADCGADYCCPVPFQLGKACQSATCELGMNGDACFANEDCTSGFCNDGSCADPLSELGDACSEDSQCASGPCCPIGTDSSKACAEACVPLPGDYCDVDHPCNGGASCWLDEFEEAGFCTRPCAGDTCGYSSSGAKNVCVSLAGCKPGCESDADCEAIHPDLYCDFDAQPVSCDFAFY